MPGLLNDYTAVHKVNGLRYFILETNTNSVVWSLKWIVLPPRYWEQEGVKYLENIVSFILSVMASVIAYYICKWLDGEE